MNHVECIVYDQVTLPASFCELMLHVFFIYEYSWCAIMMSSVGLLDYYVGARINDGESDRRQ